MQSQMHSQLVDTELQKYAARAITQIHGWGGSGGLAGENETLPGEKT